MILIYIMTNGLQSAFEKFRHSFKHFVFSILNSKIFQCFHSFRIKSTVSNCDIDLSVD